MVFLRTLREYIQSYGSDNIIYFDESGFTSATHRPHGWAVRGKKVFGNILGNNRKTKNLIMAQSPKKWLAPMIFKGSCTTELVNQWIEKMLIPELKKPSVIVMDNAAFHNKIQIKAILEKAGHIMLALPPYSPDFNPIEQSFAIIKKRRIYQSQTLENIVIGNY
jgi:putative transposase